MSPKFKFIQGLEPIRTMPYIINQFSLLLLEHIVFKGKHNQVLQIGNKKDLDVKSLQKLGKIKELDVDYLFNYVNEKKIKS